MTSRFAFVEQIRLFAIGARLIDLDLVESGRIDRQAAVDGYDAMIALCESYDGVAPAGEWLKNAILAHQKRELLIQALRELGYIPKE